MEKLVRTIKKYKNRKLYDTLENRYTTVKEVGELQLSGTNVEVIDFNGVNVTREVVLKAILESDMLSTFKVSDLTDFILNKTNKNEVSNGN